MVLLQALEVGFVIVFMAFLVTQIFVPLVREMPLFPLFRQKNNKRR